MVETAAQEPEPQQETSPATESQVPEGADPGPPTMDYFEKGEKPPEESR